MLAFVKMQKAPLLALLFRLLSTGLLLALAVTLARLLGPEQFGVYAFVFALMQVSVTIGRGGLPNMLVRDVAVSHANHDIGLTRHYLRLGWMVASPMALLMAVVFGTILLPLLTRDMDLPQSAALGGMTYIAAFILVGMLEAALRGSGRVLLGQMSELLIRPSVQLAIVAWAALGLTRTVLDVRVALGAATIAGLCALGFTLAAYLRATDFLNPTPRSISQPFLRGLLTMSGTLWISALNGHLNLILLGVFGTEVEVGLFQVAAQLSTLMTLGLITVNTSVAPEMSRLMASRAEGDARLLQRLASRTCEMSLAFGLPIGIIYVLFGGQLIPAIFGAAFSEAYWPTVILALGQVLNICFGAVATLLYSNNQESVVLRAIIFATIANALLCLLLIPAYGAIGSAIAVTVSLAIWNIISFVRLRATTGIVSLPFFTELHSVKTG